MNYFELQMLAEARRWEMQYEEKQTQLASHRFRVRRRRTPWIGLLSTLVVLGVVIWRLL
jgi:hypothetical protein